MANKANCERLATRIERQPHASQFYARKGFNMREYTHSCGAPSCIAGHVDWLLHKKVRQPGGLTYIEQVADFLEVSYSVAEDLCIPIDIKVSYAEITPEQGAQAIRNIAEGARSCATIWRHVK